MPAPLAAAIRDLLVIGGGVNGCGIARDAAGRGLSVTLLEQDDLASGTSQWSTKLIHGGLRYLEHYAFRLVGEALAEREVLLASAPHLIRPMRFVLPVAPGGRPWWLVRLGLAFYDTLGGRRSLPGTRDLDLRRDPAGAPLKPGFGRAFEYSDCAVDDARLVVLLAVDAAERGADIRVRTRAERAVVADGVWRVTASAAGQAETHRARALVLASGPWVGETATQVAGANAAPPIRLVKGSHIVTRRLFEHDRAYLLQNPDGRVVFAIPFEGAFTLVGTTDIDASSPTDTTISEAETAYLVETINRWFARPISRADIVWSYAGVRPLYDDGASAAKDATRDYVLDVDTAAGAPRLTIYGGKITTFRRLAEAALAKLAAADPALKRGAPWTARAVLPGGDLPAGGVDALAAELRRAAPRLGAETATRLARAYGTRALRFAGEVERDGLSEAELRHLVEHEWARTADDVLWRRSKLGLALPEAERAALPGRIAALYSPITSGQA
jgi:glycerol-3-phosphate dehydrogenase